MQTCLDLFKKTKIDPTIGNAPFDLLQYDALEVLKIYSQRAKGKTAMVEQLINGEIATPSKRDSPRDKLNQSLSAYRDNPLNQSMHHSASTKLLSQASPLN